MKIESSQAVEEFDLRKFIDLLTGLGILQKNEVKVYGQLMETPNITGKELSQILDIPDSKVYPALVQLINKQLINSTGTRPAKYWIEDPKALFAYLRAVKEEEMHHFNDTLKELEELQETIMNKSTTVDQASLVMHLKENQIPHQILASFMQAKKSLMLIIAPNFFNIIPFERFSTKYLSKIDDVMARIAFPPEEASSLLNTISGAISNLNSGLVKVKRLFEMGRLEIKLSKMEMSSYMVVDSEVVFQIFHTPVETFAIISKDGQFVKLVESQFATNEYTAPLI
ncbi:MAG: hypothetical protein D6732_06595 [Methanobacteriota archaeon]|nr:MAG: hypothetical protein D6732_06595 [Euryarchaeota archaeon]